MDENIRKLLETQETARRRLESITEAANLVKGQTAAAKISEWMQREEAMLQQFQSLTQAVNIAQVNSAASLTRELAEREKAHIQSLAHTLNITQAHSAASLAREIAQREEAMRAAFGPFDELRRSGLLDAKLKVDNELTRFANDMTEMQQRFRLPEIAEAARLFKQVNFDRLPTAKLLDIGHHAALQQAVAAMRAPWLDAQNQLQSLTAFSELQSIGLTLRSLPAFDQTTARALRLELGDWRKEIAWPSAIFSDPVARSAFYEAQGLNTHLTTFPADAFQQCVEIAGLKSRVPAPAPEYYVEAEAVPDEEVGFERTNAAHDRLQRFESRLRKFIATKMTEAFGENWIKHQVPGPIRQRWLEKQEKARKSGERQAPLIAYADFTDYVQLIVRKDNWEKVFKTTFQRTSSVEESFQRLYPIRICTMHARIITQDDELYLLVETKRLLGAIGVSA